jgi:membrane associated rhomboid family serine protease
MGFADRRYDGSFGPGFASGWSATTALIAITVAVWVANLLFFDVVPVNGLLALAGDLPSRPLRAWNLLTYGFAHDSKNILHLAMNMLAIFFFGREVEDILGRAEFVRFYVAAIVVAGLAWVVSVQLFTPLDAPHRWLVGASGAVMGVMAVFIWHYPNMELLLFGFLPMPAWALGLLYLGWDAYGAYEGGDHVAHVAHIGGAAFGLCYAWRGWNLGELLPSFPAWRQRLRVVHPPRGDDAPRRGSGGRSRDDADEGDQDEVDRILEKISRAGESSLTPDERATLTEASRRLRERHRS